MTKTKNKIPNITPDPLKDQFFLQEENIIKQIVNFSNPNKKDVILEVGAGTGNLTSEIAKYVNRVITFEIDEKFKPYLSKLPKNVEVHYENVWSYVQLHGKWVKKRKYNKIVANPPYSFIEPFLHNLTFLIYDKVILLVPKRTLKTLTNSGIFSSFFKFTILLDVPKENFFPIPRTNSVVIDLLKLPDPVKTKNLGLFLRQYIYQHETQLVKNSLMEGLIKYERLVNKKIMTKNDARKIIKAKNFKERDLNDTPGTNELYIEISAKFASE